MANIDVYQWGEKQSIRHFKTQNQNQTIHTPTEIKTIICDEQKQQTNNEE